MRRVALILAILGIGAMTALLGGCKNPPTKEETSSVEYGPRPDNFEQLVRDYLKPKLTDPAAIIEFKAGPARLYQQDTALRALQRSEEHTSELQSPYDLVCRLLLEKKK